MTPFNKAWIFLKSGTDLRNIEWRPDRNIAYASPSGTEGWNYGGTRPAPRMERDGMESCPQCGAVKNKINETCWSCSKEKAEMEALYPEDNGGGQ